MGVLGPVSLTVLFCCLSESVPYWDIDMTRPNGLLKHLMLFLSFNMETSWERMHNHCPHLYSTINNKHSKRAQELCYEHNHQGVLSDSEDSQDQSGQVYWYLCEALCDWFLVLKGTLWVNFTCLITLRDFSFLLIITVTTLCVSWCHCMTEDLHHTV